MALKMRLMGSTVLRAEKGTSPRLCEMQMPPIMGDSWPKRRPIIAGRI
jgi:hypothetical protein